MKSRHLLLALAHFLCLAAPALATTRHVDLNNPSPTPPYTNWPAAATNIQDAIDTSSNGDLILVTNGLYNTGSRTAIDSTPCRVVINKPVTIRSINGPEATVIEGYSLPGQFPFSLNSVRCAYMTNGATLVGFMLSKGSVRATSYANLNQPAGGVYCESTSAVLSNCVIIDCASYIGGGAQSGSFFNCLITNCLGHIGGGLHSVDANNSIIYYNVAATGGDDIIFGTFTNCCAPSLPADSGNITNEPLFIDFFDIPDNFHLQSNSPCINAGNNAFAPGPKDLDGRPRIVGPKVDIGAYEFQGTDIGDFITWLWIYYLPTDISADFADPDGDGMNNWQE